MKRAITLLVLLLLPRRGWRRAMAQYLALATPTNSQGEWSFDEGVFGRSTSFGSQASITRTRRDMASRRISRCHSHSRSSSATRACRLPEFSRETISIPLSHGDFSTEQRRLALALRAPPSLVSRFPARSLGSRESRTRQTFPARWFGAVTGMASLSHYVWLGATYTKFYEHDGDKRPDVFDYSLVYGYRPPKWRRPPDKWDWRLFGELVGERSNRFLQANARCC